jgi:hypothetical protein
MKIIILNQKREQKSIHHLMNALKQKEEIFLPAVRPGPVTGFPIPSPPGFLPMTGYIIHTSGRHGPIPGLVPVLSPGVNPFTIHPHMVW